MITITLNGSPYTTNESVTLDKLINNLDLDERKIAIEKNYEIIPKTAFNETYIDNGDEVEIVHFIGGG